MFKKKILFVITKGNWGGAQKYVFDLATSLNSQNFDVVVAYGEGELLPQKLEATKIQTIHIPKLGRNINPLSDISSFFTLIKIFKQEKPDVIHLNSSKIGGLGALAGRCAGIKKIIFTAHGWAFNEERNIISKSLIIFLSWLTIIFNHKIIVLGEKEKNQALKFPFSRNKIIKIPIGVKPIEFKTRLEAREFIQEKACTLPESISETWIGTISELHKNKGLSYAIEAFALLKSPAHFFIIGTGEEKQDLLNLIKQKNLEEKVHFLGGPTEFKNAATYLKAFDIFLLSSIKEGLPYVVLEAGLAGVPVISTNVGAIPEVIENNVSGLLVSPKKPEEIKKALESLIKNTEKQKEFGEKLKEKVERDFGIRRMVEETGKVYY